MARRNVIVCDRCEREDTLAGDNFKTLDIPILKDRGRAKSSSPVTTDNEFDLCGHCYFALGQLLRNFLDDIPFSVEQAKERT